jgi:hypothetical protein
MFSSLFSMDVATLALGLQPRQGLARVQAKRETWELHFMLPGVQKSVREWTLTLPRELSLWELESQWTLKFLESNCRGQNSLDWSVPYIIEKILERRCLKCARMTHLDIWNTSYGQKKGRESNWQFDSRPLKVRNQPDFLACRWHATYNWKDLNESYNFALDLISIRGLQRKLWAPKLRESQVWEFQDSHLSQVPSPKSWDKMPFGCGPRGEEKNIL